MMVLDTHIHTCVYSHCSILRPEDMILRAVEMRLDGLAVTEHGMRWPDEKFNELKRLADPHGLVLINGQEIYTSGLQSRMEGEFLVFGLRRSLMRNYTARELVEIVHGEGGILIAAHPYKISRDRRTLYYGTGDGVYDLRVDGLELCHPDHSDIALKRAQKAMEKLGIPGTGGSDAHDVFAVGSCVTVFDHDITGQEDFIREISRGFIRAERRF